LPRSMASAATPCNALHATCTWATRRSCGQGRRYCRYPSTGSEMIVISSEVARAMVRLTDGGDPSLVRELISFQTRRLPCCAVSLSSSVSPLSRCQRQPKPICLTAPSRPQAGASAVCFRTGRHRRARGAGRPRHRRARGAGRRPRHRRRVNGHGRLPERTTPGGSGDPAISARTLSARDDDTSGSSAFPH
jgi:hypothetical protein